jgi:GT2 family glycosyltransferase
MKVAVVIPTYGRPEIISRLLRHLEGQHRLPDAVVVSAVDPAHVPDTGPVPFTLTVLIKGHGLCAQRNHALELVLPWADVVTFLDDDFIPADDYLSRLVAWFDRVPEAAAIMGHVAVDGAQHAGLSFDEGLTVLRAIETDPPPIGEPVDETGAYGCNMSIRAAFIGPMRFDERLALYGWQEDIDFTHRLRAQGRVIKVDDLQGVHLGFKAGRVSGLRFGYSQVINPAYLIAKGSMPRRFAMRLMARNLCANAARSLWPEPYVDRWGRLKGNLLGTLHLARGRIEPEHILHL